MSFKKATKSAQKLKLLLQGASGSGKTYSALILGSEIAKSTGKRIAFIDSENGSASLYADKFDFDVLELKDYSVNSYIEAINEARRSDKHSVIIVDSITQEWDWVKKQVEIFANSTMKGNSYMAWSKGTDLHNQFLKSILLCDKHLICTVRAKTEYETQENDKGKKTYIKIGLGAEMRTGIEYEFTTSFMIDQTNWCLADKDRTDIFKKKEAFKISIDTANEFLTWLNNIPAQEQQELLQEAKEQLLNSDPESYIDYINSGEICKKISNAELLLELKKFAFDKATEKEFKLNSDKTQFVLEVKKSADTCNEDLSVYEKQNINIPKINAEEKELKIKDDKEVSYDLANSINFYSMQ